MECEKLDLFLKKSLATEETEGVSVHGWRADMRQCGRSGEHYAADILGVMIHQVLGPKARLVMLCVITANKNFILYL